MMLGDWFRRVTGYSDALHATKALVNEQRELIVALRYELAEQRRMVTQLQEKIAVARPATWTETSTYARREEQ